MEDRMDGGRVRYGRLFNLGNYENERIDVEVVVEPGETHAQAFTRAKAEVDGLASLAQSERGKRSQLEDTQQSLWRAQNHLATLARHHREAADKAQQLTTLLAKHGVNVTIPEHLLTPITVPTGPFTHELDDEDTDD
jgi:hypothetical protein